MSKDKVKGSIAVELNPTVDFIAGTIAGTASLVIGFPLDTVKVRFQNPGIVGRYHSTLHAIATISREERFIGLYKGIMSPLGSCQFFLSNYSLSPSTTIALLNGMVFASYKLFMKLQLPNSQSIPTLSQIALAGAGTGIVGSVVATPVELIKIRQQSRFVPTTARQVGLQIFREAGITGLFRGVTATALRDCGYGAYFATYEATCRYFSPSTYTQADGETKRQSWPALLLAGGIAGIAGWLFTFPFDVVKTRMQSTHRDRQSMPPPTTTTTTTALLGPRPFPEPGVINPYRSTWSTITYSYRTEGFGVFYRGLTPTLIRAIPTNMVTFAAFETVVHALT